MVLGWRTIAHKEGDGPGVDRVSAFFLKWRGFYQGWFLNRYKMGEDIQVGKMIVLG